MKKHQSIAIYHNLNIQHVCLLCFASGGCNILSSSSMQNGMEERRINEEKKQGRRGAQEKEIISSVSVSFHG